MRRMSLLITSVMAWPATAGAQNGVAGAANSITPADFQRRIDVIAHDSMQGRDTPSRGLDLTARWIADEFRRFGLRAGGDDGDFIQRYPLQQARLDRHASSLSLGGTAWRMGDDVVRLFGGNDVEIEANRVVIVGNAAALEGADLQGAVALVVTPTDDEGQVTSAGRQLLVRTFRRSPAAVIGVADLSDAAWRRYEAALAQPTISRPGGRARRRPGRPILLVRPATVDVALRAHRIDLAAAARATSAETRTGVAVKLTLRAERAGALTAPNTVGILEGRDPALKHEYVVFSAHMDHVGTASGGRCRASGADTICNGADDDASGTVGIVELAEAFAMMEPRPRRSLIFLTVSGEERGLWGSAHYAANPSVPIGQIVANLNADMIGRNWTDTIVVIGKEHSDLGATLHRVNAAHPELNMTAIDDLWPEQNFYGRSDHFNFARRGVPILFFFNGTHPDYHQPTDNPDRIDGEKASRIVKLMFYLGLDIANADEKPQWDADSYREIVTNGR